MNIIDELDGFSAIVDPNTFACIGFLTKIESLFRDMFSIYLNRKYEKSNIISIEYTDENIKRADMVILDLNGNPLTIIEFKAGYAFDLMFPKIENWFKISVQDDLSKHRSVEKNVDKYSVWLAMNPYGIPKNKAIYKNVIAYYAQHEKFLKTYSPSQFYKDSLVNINKVFQGTNIELVSSNNKIIGKSLGYTNELLFYVFR